MHAPRVSLVLSLALPILLAGCLIESSSCDFVGVRGSGVLKTEARTVGEFKRISSRGSADVAVKIGSPASVEVTADDNLVQYVTTEVKDGTLEIGMKSGSYHFSKGLKVAIRRPCSRTSRSWAARTST